MPDTDDQTTDQQTTPESDAQRDAGAATGASPRDAAATTTTDSDDDPVKLRALVEKLRPHEREAARLKRELDAANAKLKAAEDAQKSDLDKAVEERDALKAEKAAFTQRLRTQNLRHATADAAREAGFADPADVHRFLELDDLEFDDDDQPVGIAERVKELAKAKPYLLAPRQNVTNGPPATPKSDRPAGTLTADEDRQAKSLFAIHSARSF